MNGIQFIVRDQSGWTPQIEAPRSRFDWSNPPERRLTDSEANLIREARGNQTSKQLADIFEVSRQTITDIWRGRKHTGRPPGRPRKAQKAPRKRYPRKSNPPKVPA
ncbi:hypothetical protein [Achromobacter ruhlandii]|uniref:hypothetical protein n=1 Tax=Achromobacter ruhlandii TaxID=72557 RepID=UPI0007BF33F7|nr:hypothetical protein [Achromobacter ruhlandii]